MKKIDWELSLYNQQCKACRVLIDLAGAYRSVGKHAEAEIRFKEAYELAIEAKDETLQHEVTKWMGNLYYHAGRFNESCDVLSGLSVSERSPHLQTTLFAMGDYLGYLEESCRVLSELPNKESLAVKCWFQCNYLEALLTNGLFSEAWTVTRCIRNLQKQSLDVSFVYINAWCALAQAYLEFGQFDEALHYATKASGLAETEGVAGAQVRSLVVLSKVRFPNKKIIEDLNEVEVCLGNYREDPKHHIHIKLALSHVYLKLGEPGLASQQAHTASDLLDGYDRFPERFDCIITQADCEMHLMHWTKAFDLLSIAEQIEKDTIRIKNRSLTLPLAYTRLFLASADNKGFSDSLVNAQSRYSAIVADLPMSVQRSMSLRDDVRQLRALENGHISTEVKRS